MTLALGSSHLEHKYRLAFFGDRARFPRRGFVWFTRRINTSVAYRIHDRHRVVRSFLTSKPVFTNRKKAT